MSVGGVRVDWRDVEAFVRATALAVVCSVVTQTHVLITAVCWEEGISLSLSLASLSLSGLSLSIWSLSLVSLSGLSLSEGSPVQ